MAMNIGANDVANNVGPALGAGAITLIGAVILAAFFESAGALIAGWEVVNTIKKWIIDINGFADVNLYIYAMMSALLSAALWLNIATYLKAPVSSLFQWLVSSLHVSSSWLQRLICKCILHL